MLHHDYDKRGINGQSTKQHMSALLKSLLKSPDAAKKHNQLDTLSNDNSKQFLLSAKRTFWPEASVQPCGKHLWGSILENIGKYSGKSQQIQEKNTTAAQSQKYTVISYFR
jgi:hypothetical protein